jgi:hypothetical protein
METMSAHEASQRFRILRPVRPPRRALGAVVVAGVYALLALGAPLLVRYGPEPEVASAVANVGTSEPVAPRCAEAPEFGRPCTPAAVPAPAKNRFVLFVP